MLSIVAGAFALFLLAMPLEESEQYSSILYSEPSADLARLTLVAKTKVDCLDAESIKGYEVIDNRTIRFDLKDGRVAMVKVKRECGDLEYHHYISYVPMDGKLCAKTDEVITREGIHCGIKSIKILDKPSAG